MKKRERCVTYRGRGYKDRRIPANISFLSAEPFAPNFTEALAGDWLHRSFPFASGKYLSSYSPNRVLTAPSLSISLYIPQLTLVARSIHRLPYIRRANLPKPLFRVSPIDRILHDSPSDISIKCHRWNDARSTMIAWKIRDTDSNEAAYDGKLHKGRSYESLSIAKREFFPRSRRKGNCCSLNVAKKRFLIALNNRENYAKAIFLVTEISTLLAARNKKSPKFHARLQMILVAKTRDTQKALVLQNCARARDCK